MGLICPPQHTWNPRGTGGVGDSQEAGCGLSAHLGAELQLPAPHSPTNTSPALSFPHVLLPLSLRHSWGCQVVMQLFHVSIQHSNQSQLP